MKRVQSGQLHGAVLGTTHPHAAKLVQTLENLPEVGGISIWQDERAPVSTVAGGPKQRLASNRLDEVLVQSGLDFAIVCVRTDRAAEVALHAISAGKHLVVEKPGGMSAAEIRNVERAADRAGVKVAVLYVRRMHPAVRHARSLFQQGKLGPLLSIEARLITTQVRFRNPASWLFRRRLAGGGILTWLGCHYLDLMHYITGEEFAAVSAALARRNGERIDVEDTAAVALRLRSGAVGTFHAGYALAHSGGGYFNSAGNDAYIACNARKGRVVWPSLNARFLHVEGGGRPPVRDVSFKLARSTSYAGALGDQFFREFCAALRGDGPLPSSLTDACRVAEVVEACQKSSRERREARVGA